MTLHPSIESVVANSSVSSDFLLEGQVSGLGTVHPISPLTSSACGCFSSSCVSHLLTLCSKPFGNAAMDDGGRLRSELAASGSCSAYRRP